MKVRFSMILAGIAAVSLLVACCGKGEKKCCKQEEGCCGQKTECCQQFCKKLPVGVQLYSVRTDLEKDFYGTLKAIREMGYAGVEFYGEWGIFCCL